MRPAIFSALRTLPKGVRFGGDGFDEVVTVRERGRPATSRRVSTSTMEGT